MNFLSLKKFELLDLFSNYIQNAKRPKKFGFRFSILFSLNVSTIQLSFII